MSNFLESPKAGDRPSNFKAGPFGRHLTVTEYRNLTYLRGVIGGRLGQLVTLDPGTLDNPSGSITWPAVIRAVKARFVGNEFGKWAVLINHPSSSDFALVARLYGRITLERFCSARWDQEFMAALWIKENPDFKVSPRLRLENCNPRPVEVATLNQPGG